MYYTPTDDSAQDDQGSACYGAGYGTRPGVHDHMVAVDLSRSEAHGQAIDTTTSSWTQPVCSAQMPHAQHPAHSTPMQPHFYSPYGCTAPPPSAAPPAYHSVCQYQPPPPSSNVGAHMCGSHPPVSPDVVGTLSQQLQQMQTQMQMQTQLLHAQQRTIDTLQQQLQTPATPASNPRSSSA